MKTNINQSRTLLCLAAVLLASHSSWEAAFGADAPKQSTTNAIVRIKFRPATTTAPSVRVTGGSRGTGDATVTLDVLAPDDVGITTQEQPSLFWYQSKPAAAKFELTLIQENKVKPILQVLAEHSTKAGIQRVRLSEHDARLTPGVEYQWVVALVTDPANRSSDLVASGVIKRVEAPADLKEKISKASPTSIPALYAEAGIWYDALAALSDQVEANPNDTALRKARADLLAQVGLKAAAQAESAKANSPN
jgi:hypothetical protein